MKPRMISVVALILAVALLAGISFGATKATAKNVLRVKVGKLSGVVADPTGKPLPNVPLRLKQGKKLVLETRTDKVGKYEIKDLVVGKYLLLTGAERALELEVTSVAKVASLQIVVPQSRLYASAAVTQSQWIWAAVGTGAAVVAVSVPVLANENDWFSSSSSDDTVSP